MTMTRNGQATTIARTDEQPVEVAEFLAVLDSDVAGDGLTYCPGRTVHTLAAHIAGNYAEITRHVDGYLDRRPVARTRTFDEREGEFRALSAPRLMCAIEEGDERMRRAIGTLLAAEPDPVLRWTNREVHAAGFLKHARSECAVHRWDIVGDDPVSERLLAPHELLEHVVTFLGPLPLTARGMATGAGTGASLTARIRSAERPDLMVRVHRGQPSFSLVEPEGTALIEADPAARLLFVWGRRPSPFSRLRARGPVEDVARLQWLLSGY
jgi:hypothetical protein